MIKYENYIDSKVSWFGYVPSHWLINRLKYFAKNVKTGTTPSSSKGDFFSEGTEIWYTPSDIKNNIIFNSSRKVTKEAFKQKELFLFPENSLYLIGIGGTLGNIGFSLVKASCNQQINVIEFNKNFINPKFGYYQFLVIGSTLIKWSNYTTMPIFTQTNSKNLDFLIPPLNEQTQIVNFIDNKTNAIDKKINLLIQKANYYKEYRKSVINEAVSKGLDKNVKYKDSGVEGFGDIPVHWDILRLKSLGNIETSSVDKKIVENEDLVKLVNYTDVYGNLNKEIVNNDNFMIVSANIKQVKSKFLKKGDVLFTPSSETIEDIGVSAVVMEDLENTLYSYHLLRLRFSKEVHLNFKKYLFNNDLVQNYLSKSATGTTRKILGLSTFYNIPMILPKKLKEQEEIATYLDNKTEVIDKILSNISLQIITLKELRKTLINDVVTGKIKVTQD